MVLVFIGNQSIELKRERDPPKKPVIQSIVSSDSMTMTWSMGTEILSPNFIEKKKLEIYKISSFQREGFVKF